MKPEPIHSLLAATDRDATAIRALLESNGLPTADLETSRPEFYVASEDAVVVGVGGLQRFDSAGLLRSVAVSLSHRRSGLGSRIVEFIERRAADAGLSDIYLLTETAEHFFGKRGYRTIERRNVPGVVQASAEFGSLHLLHTRH